MVEYSAPDLVRGYHLAILRPRGNSILGAYLLRGLQAQGVAAQFHVSANGITRYGLTHNPIKSVIVPVRSLTDQGDIMCVLDAATSELDGAIATARREIDLLNEYRRLLTADVVTGKVDVREGAARLPEGPADLEAPEGDLLDGEAEPESEEEAVADVAD